MSARRPAPQLLSLLVLALLSACDGNAATTGQSELRELVLSSAPPEDPGSHLMGPARFSQRETLEQIAELAKNKSVSGLLLRIGPLAGAWARQAELRDALLTVRATKKPVHCYFENTDNVGYGLLARVCDRITMTPTGTLSLVGVHAEIVYARDLLETLGLHAEVMQVGRFKGAADLFTRSDMPIETEQTMGALLDDLQHDLTSAVSQGRSLTAADLTRAIDQGPDTAQTALSLRLIDAIGFDDEARAQAKASTHAQRVVLMPEHPEVERKGLFELIKTLTSSESEEPAHGKRIALAYLEGTIGDSDDDSGSFSNAGPFVKAMRHIADDVDVRALVLRIQSPGGSALASDKMWHAVRRVAHRKPVIVSIGDMAASGGYYVACAGNEIMAQRTSLVGSIGVVGGKIVGEQLAQRLGVHVAVLSRGKNAAWLSPTQRFSDSERAALVRALQSTYDTFLSRVSEGRHLHGERLNAVAEGRLMTGERARVGGLVDSEGGLLQALARARTKAGVGADAAIEVWPRQRNFLDRIAHMVSGASAYSAGVQGLHALLPGAFDAPLASLLLGGSAGAFAALPFGLEIH
ncbi:MAG TPA: signal peptide peptidase SppA [Polyangiales bacterium]